VSNGSAIFRAAEERREREASERRRHSAKATEARGALNDTLRDIRATRRAGSDERLSALQQRPEGARRAAVDQTVRLVGAERTETPAERQARTRAEAARARQEPVPPSADEAVEIARLRVETARSEVETARARAEMQERQQ
jgi:hypothetical protein